jgi:hypothetical protein
VTNKPLSCPYISYLHAMFSSNSGQGRNTPLTFGLNEKICKVFKIFLKGYNIPLIYIRPILSFLNLIGVTNKPLSYPYIYVIFVQCSLPILVRGEKLPRLGLNEKKLQSF